MYGPTIEPTKCNCKNDFFRRAIKCTQEISIRSSCGPLLLWFGVCLSVLRVACGRGASLRRVRGLAGPPASFLQRKEAAVAPEYLESQ